MIGSHNSFTHLSSDSTLNNNFSAFWRCQDKTVVEQYEAGVRFFDIRIKAIEKKNKVMWEVCHGSAGLGKTFISINSICTYVQKSLPNATFRLLLERGGYEDKFIEDSLEAVNKFGDILLFVAIKSGWNIIYQSPNMPQIIDYCYVPWHSGDSFWENIKNFSFSTIRGYAKAHNPEITEDMIEDKNVIHFMDFI